MTLLDVYFLAAAIGGLATFPFWFLWKKKKFLDDALLCPGPCGKYRPRKAFWISVIGLPARYLCDNCYHRIMRVPPHLDNCARRLFE